MEELLRQARESRGSGGPSVPDFNKAEHLKTKPSETYASSADENIVSTSEEESDTDTEEEVMNLDMKTCQMKYGVSEQNMFTIIKFTAL